MLLLAAFAVNNINKKAAGQSKRIWMMVVYKVHTLSCQKHTPTTQISNGGSLFCTQNSLFQQQDLAFTTSKLLWWPGFFRGLPNTKMPSLKRSQATTTMIYDLYVAIEGREKHALNFFAGKEAAMLKMCLCRQDIVLSMY